MNYLDTAKIFNWESYKPPIVIFGYPRSGTSLTAELFYLHGVWAGTCNPGVKDLHPDGKFEHVRLGKNQNRNFKDHVDQVLKEDGYIGGYWLAKRKINNSRIKKWAVLNPYFVLVRRSQKDIVRSRKRVHKYKKESTDISTEIQGIKKANQLMDYVKSRYGGMDIHTDLLITGDYSEIKNVFSKIGIEFNPNIANNCIRPDLWKRSL